MDLTRRIQTVSCLMFLLCCGCLANVEPNCKESDPCHCKASNGSVINLEALAFRNGTARFQKDWKSPDNESTITVFYNPCKPFTLPDQECKDAAGCTATVESDIHYTKKMGEQDGAKWTLGDPTILNYTFGDRFFEVRLQCENKSINASVLTIQKVEDNSVHAELTSVCACYGGCSNGGDVPQPDEKNGLSTGSILVIMFFTLLVAYLLGGMIYKKVVYGATGKELIPNVEFWMVFPKLVLDGVAFTCNCCRKRHGSQGYDDV